MSTAPAAPPTTAAADRRPARTLPWWGFGIANVVVIVVVSILLWWLLIDPEWSPVGAYGKAGQPFEAILFWSIIVTVWVAFNCGWTGPARLRQPGRGLVGILIVLAIAAAIVVLLAYAYSLVDPSFAASRDAKGTGFKTGQVIVLFAFFFYVMAAINWNHWPWSDKLEQPWAGVASIATFVLPTLVLFAVLAMPNLAVYATTDAASPEKLAAPIIGANTLVGWFYSCIVAVVVTGLIWDNKPWALARTPARIAWVSLVGNLVFGTALYFGTLAMAKLLMGPANVAALSDSSDSITAYAAEFGVCWVFWMIAWANVFGNKPTHLSEVANLVVRTVVTLVLAVGTFLVYHFVFAGSVLHEPAPAGDIHGDALGFINFAVLITLFYVLFLESPGLPRAEPDAAEADAETIAHETGHAHRA